MTLRRLCLCVIYLIYVLKNVACKENIWYSYQFGSGHGNREELIISKVEAVDNFKTEEVVVNWKTLSLKHKSFALGLTGNGVTVLQAALDGNGSRNFVTNSSHIPMNGTVLDAFLFEYWNNSFNYNNDIIAVVAIKNIPDNQVKLRWFKLTDNNELINVWNLDWKKNITHLNVFKVDEKYHLLICNDRYENYTTADLYEFSLGKHPDFWLIQKIHLSSPTRSSSVTNYGVDVYLSLPQAEGIQVYKFDTNHFMPQWNLTAGNAHYVTSFKIGFRAFLAIDGYSAGIYKFSEDGFAKQDIQDANLNQIDYWLSIPIRTYRDEEILIAERSLDHGSHKSFAIEVILYNGGKFMVHDEMECHYYGDASNGMNCLVEEETSVGIKGSAYLSVGDALGLLVPRNHTTSRLFTIHTQVKEVESPLQKQIKILNSFKERLQDKIDQQNIRLQQLESSLKNSIKVDEENVISAPWKVDTLAASALRKSNDAVFNISEDTDLQNLFDRIASIKNTINDLNSKVLNIVPITSRPVFNKLVVNGPVEILGTSNIQTLETQSFNDGFDFSDAVRLDDSRLIPSQKTFSNVVVDSLTLDTLNGIKADHLVFNDTDEVVLQGDIVFERDVTVFKDVHTTNINDFNLVDELIQVGVNYEDAISFENLKTNGSLEVQKANKFPIHDNYLDATRVDDISEDIEADGFETLYIPGNLTVKNINGENLQDLIFSLVLRNINTHIPSETTILGSIEVDTASTVLLNDIDFETGYIFGNSNQFYEITGKKVFTSETIMKELSTLGTINGVGLDNIVTLSENQTLFGKFTFEDLHIPENYEIEGNITWPGKDHNTSNPTLLNSNKISANVNFNNLEVDGLIIIENGFNGTHLRNLLNDVVYKHLETAEISSIKVFQKGLIIRKNLNVKSNAINSVDIGSFVRKDAEQSIEAKTLNGNVTFENLILAGNFGEVNISQLKQETVKLSGEQFTFAELIFEDGVSINELNVTKTLNDIDVTDYLFGDGNRILDSSGFNRLQVDYLEIRGNLNTTEQNFNLEDFDNRRLSYTKDQMLMGSVDINNSKIRNLKPQLINDHYFNEMFDTNVYAEKVKGILETGKVNIKEMYVEDALNISMVNNIPINEILKNCVWTQNTSKTRMEFRDIVNFQNIEVESLNNENFTTLMENVIYKNESDLEIVGPKIFVKGYEILNFVNTPQLNSKFVQNILRKGGDQSIHSELLIEADVLISSDCELNGTLSNVNLEEFSEQFEFLDGDHYRINGHVDFTRIAHINNFILETNINEEKVGDFLNSIINVNQDKNISGNVKFEKPVTITSNLAASQGINSIDVSNLKNNIVLITQDSAIDSLVQFKESVTVTEALEVDEDLWSATVMNINLERWKDRPVYINKGKILGTLQFEEAYAENNILTNSINGIDMESLIPLRTDQVIPQELHFGEVSSFKDITVTDFVNGYKLETELYNSVLSGRIQEITSNVIFEGNVLVHAHLDISGLVNGHDFTKLVTLNEVQNLNATYEFSKRATIIGHMLVNGRINGINITEWEHNSLKKYVQQPQTVVKPWRLQNSLIFGNNVWSNGTISTLDLRIVADQVEERRLFKHNIELQLIEQFKTICNDLNGIVSASKRQIYLFEYLEYQQILDFQYNIDNVHYIEFQGLNYMLVTDDTSCLSELYGWNGTSFSLVRQIETGKISQMITVRDGDYVFLVSRNSYDRTECQVEGVKVWKFSIDNITPLYVIDDCIDLQDSLVPGTFYALDAIGVYEYKIITLADTNIYKVRRWIVDTANVAFVPRGLNLGFALRNGRQLMKLSREDPISQDDLGFNYNSVIVGNVTLEENRYMPGRDAGEMLLMKVGYPRKRTLIAVSSQEKTSVKGKLDNIKIYEDSKSGLLYHKIITDAPSSLLSLEFGENGETLLVFLENKEHLVVYEYKGIEGYKRRTSITIHGSKLVQLILPFGDNKKPRNFIGVISKNRLTLLQAVMEGDQVIDENLQCNL